MLSILAPSHFRIVMVGRLPASCLSIGNGRKYIIENFNHADGFDVSVEMVMTDTRVQSVSYLSR